MTETGEFLTTFVVNSLWQIPLIAATAALCSRLMRSVPSVYRHLVWVAALGLCICLPVESLWSSNRVGHNFSPASSQVSEADNGDRELGDNLAHKRFSFMRQTHSFHVAFTPILAWIFGSCFAGFLLYRLATIGWSLRCTLKLRDAGYTRNLPGPLFLTAIRCLKAFNVPDVAIICSPDAIGPVTRRRSASGASDLCRTGWRVCTTSRGRVRPARSAMNKSSRWWCARWKAPHGGPRIGVLARWPRPAGTVT